MDARAEETPARYVEPTDQLVVEVFVREMARSKAFYTRLGFAVLADRGTFVELGWEGHRLFLDQRTNLPPPPEMPQVNVRVLVPDVDRYWRIAAEIGARVFAPIQDQSYGLRDFTILDPDGVGLRFGTRLPGSEH